VSGEKPKKSMPIKTIIEPLRIKSIEAIRQRHQIHFRVFAEYQRPISTEKISARLKPVTS
jgi:hypothetical protein